MQSSPTQAQYAAANKASGAHTAAQALFDRLAEADAGPVALAVAEAFCQQRAAAYAQAYEPIYEHLTQALSATPATL